MICWCSVPVRKDASDDMTLNTTLNTTDPASGILNCNIYPHATNCTVEIVKLILTYVTTVNMFGNHSTACKLFVAQILNAAPHGEVLSISYCQGDFCQIPFQQSTTMRDLWRVTPNQMLHSCHYLSTFSWIVMSRRKRWVPLSSLRMTCTVRLSSHSLLNAVVQCVAYTMPRWRALWIMQRCIEEFRWLSFHKNLRRNVKLELQPDANKKWWSCFVTTWITNQQSGLMLRR